MNFLDPPHGIVATPPPASPSFAHLCLLAAAYIFGAFGLGCALVLCQVL